MAAGPGPLIRWLSDRLALAAAFDVPLPTWPPSPEVMQALDEGRVDDAPLVADRDARYVVIRRLRGDAPHVFVAVDRVVQREVVLKLSRDASQTARLLAIREARLMAVFQHPGIVVIHEADRLGRFLIVEKLDADLRDLDGLAPELVLDAFCQASRALAAAHGHGIYHGDFRPENVLVQLKKDQRGQVVGLWAKVADFGHAIDSRPRHGFAQSRDVNAARIARSGDVNAARIAQAHAAADQHAFAVALWECLAGGRRPPDGEELIPEQLHAVLAKALMMEPSQRWADMTALVDAIERGREAAAVVPRAATRQRAEWTDAFELAIAYAEDGMFAVAHQHWRAVQREVRDAGECGRAGFALGAALFRAAQRASGEAKQHGYRRCLDVLEDAAASLADAGELESADDASELAARTCEAWMDTYPPESTEHQHLAELARAYRGRS